MDQHPIPQNVTAYQFRLVGDMTLKQFLELAGGLLAAFLTTRFTLLPVFFRWPLAGILAFGGIALAFLPVEERPLDTWLKNFIRSIYSPTQFLWQKTHPVPDFLTYIPPKVLATPTKITPKDQKYLQSFMQTMRPPAPKNPVDIQEFSSLGRINQLLGTKLAATAPTPTQPTLSASPGIKLRKLQTPEQIKKEAVVWQRQIGQKVKNIKPPPMSAVKPTVPPPKPAPEATGPIVEMVPALRPPLTVATLFPPPLSVRDGKRRVAPEFAYDLPLPSPPEAPNLVNGMVVTMEDRLLPNSIVEICNSQNQTVRAVKTNKLGQFFIATPLLNDNYEMRVEHPEYTFDIIKIKAEGKIIPPIKIRAKSKAPVEVGNQGVGI